MTNKGNVIYMDYWKILIFYLKRRKILDSRNNEYLS